MTRTPTSEFATVDCLAFTCFNSFPGFYIFFGKRKNKRETEKHESATLDSESGRVLMRLFFAQHSVYGHITLTAPVLV